MAWLLESLGQEGGLEVMGGLVAPYDSRSSSPLRPPINPSHVNLWQEEEELVPPQGWEGEGRARTSKNRVIILLPPVSAPSRFCGPKQLRCECASGRVRWPCGSAARVPPAEAAAAAAAGPSGRVPRGDPGPAAQAAAASCQCWALGREVVRVLRCPKQARAGGVRLGAAAPRPGSVCGAQAGAGADPWGWTDPWG